MSLRRQTETRTFQGGWVSDVSRARQLDAFRLPKGWWDSPTEVGALETTPGRTETADATLDILSFYRAESKDGTTVLRVVQEDTALKVLNAAGTIGATLKSGLTATKKLSYCVMSGTDDIEYLFCFNGTDTPFKVKLSDNSVSDIGLTRPDVTQGPITVALTGISGTITTTDASPATTLIDSGAGFQAADVRIGDLVTNTVDLSTATVTSIDSATQITHTALAGGTDNNWDTSDTYTVTAGSGNSVKGIVKYWIAEVSSTTESALSTASGTIDCGDGARVKITFPNDAEWNSKTFKLYRTYRDQHTPFYVPGSQTDISSTGGFIIDGSPDAELGDPPYAHGDPPPATATSCLSYFNRIYVLDGNKVLWSDIGNPESFFTQAGGGHLILGQNDGDVGVALTSDIDGILAFKKNHLYKIHGRQPGEFQVEEVVPSSQEARSVGTPNTTSFTHTPTGIIFWFNEQFYRYSYNRVTRISELVEDDLITLRGSSDFTGTDKWDVVLQYVPRNSRVWASIHPSTSDDTFTCFYDTVRRRFVGAMESGYRCYLVDGEGSSENLIMGGSRGAPSASHDTTKIYTVDYTTTLARDQSVILYPAGISNPNIKRFFHWDVVMKNVGAARAADVFIDVDGVRTTTGTAVAVNDSGSQSRRKTRIYGRAVGHDSELTFTGDSGTNSTNPLTLYSATCSYQDMGPDVAAVMTS